MNNWDDPIWKVGDRITFRAICRWPTRVVTRKVTSLSWAGWPNVRFEGCANFTVRPSEIRAVNGDDIHNKRLATAAQAALWSKGGAA